MLLDLCQVVAALKDNTCLRQSRFIDELHQAFVWPTKLEPLQWLESQAIYPKCYWQSRDGEEEVLALGQLAEFDNERQARDFIKSGQRVWGGRKFANKHQTQSYFFLPILELSRRGDKWMLKLNLQSNIQPISSLLSLLDFTIAPQAVLQNEGLNNNCLNNKVLSKVHRPEFADWSNRVEHVLAKIASTALQKVVLARKTTVNFATPISAAALLNKSRQINRDHFHFLLALDETQSFIGSSPERLFKQEGDHFVTEALAGTIGRGENDIEDQMLAEWILADAKSLNENQLVVDDIKQRLASFCTFHITSKPYITKLRNIQHLRRDITGTLSDDSSLLDALQPTAAIAGLPRQMALAHILEQEPFERGWYSGCIGYMSENESEFCVALRSALIEKNQIHFYAGAGIVPGSVSLLEWDELNKKIATLLDLALENSSVEAKEHEPL